MKRRNIVIISLMSVGIFLFTAHVLSEDIKVIKLPEASSSKPVFKEEGEDKDKKEENKKANSSSALKVKLIFSKPLPLFLSRS